MTKFILIFCVLGLSWLQAAQSRHHMDFSSDEVRRDYLKILAGKVCLMCFVFCFPCLLFCLVKDLFKV